MGLARGFVFSADRRALLAVLAIAVSVGYALVAGAAVTGLKDAQEALSGDLQDQALIVQLDDGQLAALDRLGQAPTVVLATQATGDHVLYAVLSGDRDGSGPAVNASDAALAGPSSALAPGDQLTVTGPAGTRVVNVTDRLAEPTPGAASTWLRVSPQLITELTGQPAEDQARLAAYTDPAPDLAGSLTRQGLEVHRAPAATTFYTAGADQLVGAVRTTVAASTLVVGLVASAVVGMELRTRQRSFATLRLYGGPGLVSRLVAARGLVLLLAGHLLAIAATYGLLEVAERGLDLSLQLAGAHTLLAVGATMTGGLVGLIPPTVRARRPLRASALEARAPPSWLPKPLRLTVASWRLVVPLAVSALVLSASLGVVFGAVAIPSQIFGPSGNDVIAETQGNPLRGSVSSFLGDHLSEVDGYAAASPEIFAPTELDGHPVMVRGVDWAKLTDMDEVRVTRGSAPDGPGQAVVGQRLGQKLSLAIGSHLTLPSAYTASLQSVEVVGWVQAPGLLADELLVDLPVARALTDLPADRVHLVRFATDPGLEPTERAALAPPRGIEVTGLRLRPITPVPYEPVDAVIEVANFGPDTATRHLTLRVNGQPVADRWVQVGGQETRQVVLGFTAPATGVQQVQVNPTLQPEAGEPAYTLEAPPATPVDRNVTVRVLDRRDGAPVAGVQVRLDGAEATTGPDGRARLLAAQIGNRSLVADGPDGRAAQPILVVAPGAIHRPELRVVDLDGPSRIPAGTWQGVAIVENIGGAPFDGTFTVPVDGNATNATELRLLPAERARVPVQLELEAGEHTLGPPGAQRTVQVVPPGEFRSEEGTPKTVEELLELRRQQARQQRATSQQATAAFLGDTFENLNTALTIVTLATVLHAGLITLVATHRTIETRTGTIGTLSAVGATPGNLRGRAAREYLLVGAVAGLGGTVLGLALVALAAQLGWLAGFGHALVPRTDPGFVLRIATAAVATTLAAAVLSIEQARDRRLGQLVHQGPRRTERPSLDKLLREAGR